MGRTPFDQHAAVVCSAFRRCGAPGLEDGLSTGRGQALRGGSMTVLHPHGRQGPAHPPPASARHQRGRGGPGRALGASAGRALRVFCVARGSGTCCAGCATRSRRRRSTRGWRRVLGRSPTAWCPTSRRAPSPRRLRAWRVTWPRTWCAPRWRSGASSAMRASGARSRTARTGPTGWSMHPWMSPRVWAAWGNTRAPRGASASALMGCQPRRRLPR